MIRVKWDNKSQMDEQIHEIMEVLEYRITNIKCSGWLDKVHEQIHEKL